LLLNRAVQLLSPRTLPPPPKKGTPAPADSPWLDPSPGTWETYPAPLHFPNDSTKNLIGIPFGPEPSTKTIYWPVRTKRLRVVNYWDEKGEHVGFKGRGREFGWKRGKPGKKKPDRLHVGIDLYANHHDVVVAIEKGTILAYRHFYEGVWNCLVDHGDYVINYGEIEGVRFCSRTKDVKKKVVVNKDTKETKLKVVRGKCPGTRCNATCTKAKGRHANAYVVHQTYKDKRGKRKELYVVRRNKKVTETWESIAGSFFGVTVKSLKAANPKARETLKPGNKIAIPPVFSVGDTIEAGQPLGEIGRMKFDSMLHLEMYAKGTKQTHSWVKGRHGINEALTKWKRDKRDDDKKTFLAWVDRIASKSWAKPPTRVGGDKKVKVGRPDAIYFDPTKFLIYLAENAK
jgi:LysM repeat protein